MNNKKIAFILEWAGVVIIIGGVVQLALNYLGIAELPLPVDSFMLLVLGVGLFCYLPHKYQIYRESAEKSEEQSLKLRRRFLLNLIVALVFTAYGVLKLLK